MQKLDRQPTKNALIADQPSDAALTPSARKKAQPTNLWETRLLWLLVCILLGYWGYSWIGQRVDPEIHRRVLMLLRDRYPQHLISLDSAHLIPGRAVILDGLQIALPDEKGRQEVVRVGRVTATGNISLLDLASGTLSIERVSVEDCNVTLWPMESGQWSIETLASNGPLPEKLPSIDVRSGIVTVHPNATSKQEIICHDLKARLRINRDDISLAERPYELQVKLRSNYFDLISVYGNLSKDKLTWRLQGNVDRCRLSSELTDRLPVEWQASLTQLKGLDGIISSNFRVDKPRDSQPTFEINSDISNAALVHPGLPYPLEKLAGKLFVRNDMLQLRDVTASSGSATFKLKADVHGMSTSVPIVAELEAKDLPLDKRLYRVLSPRLREIWDQLQCAGIADAKLRFEFDGQTWTPNIDASVREVSIQLAQFPYPVTSLSGQFQIGPDAVTSQNVRALAGGSPIAIELNFTKTREDEGGIKVEQGEDFWAYKIALKCDRAIKIDEQLLRSLSAVGEPETGSESFIRSLHPTGLVQIRDVRLVRESLDERPKLAADLEFFNAAIAYDQFDYPIFNINGSLSIRESELTINSLVGQNDSATIRCSGSTRCDGSRLERLQLSFDAFAVPLEEELHRALPAGTRQLWDAIQPSGVIDHVWITIDQVNDNPVDIAVGIEERNGRSDNGSRTVSVRPREIPYPLTDISCQIDYRNGVAKIGQISGYHDVSYITAQGEFLTAEDGTWNGTVQWLPQSRLIVDQSLLSSLPGYLQQPFVSTAFRGPVGVMGWTSFSSSEDGNSIMVRNWDLDLAIEEGRLGFGQIASGIRGSVKVHGKFDGQDILAKGELELDSLMVYRVPVLNLKGPFAIEKAAILLGRESESIELPRPQNAFAQRQSSPVQLASYTAPRVQNAAPKSKVSPPDVNLTRTDRMDPNFLEPAKDPELFLHPNDIRADCLGGQLRVSGRHEILVGRSKLSLQLQKANLQVAMMDLSQNANGIAGTVWAQWELQGSLFNQQTLAGSGQAWLRRADLVQLPVMSRLFRVLSIRDPQSGVIESGEVRFRIDGDKIPIDALSFDGDIISLRGSGYANFRREVHLDMAAYVGKRSIVAAMLGPIISNNDSASLMSIEVDGTPEAIEVRRSLSLINASADQLFPERY